MKFANAIRFNRKSGEAEESAVSPSPYRMLMEKSFCSLGSAAEGSAVLVGWPFRLHQVRDLLGWGCFLHFGAGHKNDR